MAGQSLTHGTIEVEITNKKDEEIGKSRENKTKRPPNRYLWAMLLARIYNLFPLICPDCGSEMRVISVIQDKSVINKILKSVGEASASCSRPLPTSMQAKQLNLLSYQLLVGHQVGMITIRNN